MTGYEQTFYSVVPHAMQDLVKAVENLTKEVKELKEQLKKAEE